ncbi:MAG: glycosyltransferase family 2 protein [Chloroflexi bacterium]|nr:glycosyltransferase family 2 protein [Chloroflexota bacterium]
MSDHPTISIVAPIYNEEDSLQELHRRISGVMEPLDLSWELVMVNDGSRDRSLELMVELHERDPEHVRIVNFARNFGHQIAVTAGMDYAQGEAVVLIDADLQDPPELIPQMIEKWREGYEVVYAVRAEREGESWLKRTLSSLFYRVLFRITEIKIPLDTGDFRLMDQRVVRAVTTMPERHRFIRGMVSWVGFRQVGIEYKRDPRFAGETKYPLRKQLRLAWDGITGFSYVPLQLATYLGFIIAAMSGLSILFVIYMRAFTDELFFEGQASTLVMVLFLGGVQLISLGVIGEYLGRIYNEVKGRPLYIVHTTRGFDDSSGHPEDQRPEHHLSLSREGSVQHD